MATTLTIPLFMLLFILPIPSFSCSLHQKQVLLRFKSTLTTIFNAIPILQLDSWNQNSDCCTWDRVNCNTTASVTELHLNAIIPQSVNRVSVSSDILIPLFQIQSLELLDISMNSIQGQIPGDGFGNLTRLIHLDMTRNSFSGRIPSVLFNITTLKKLFLGRKGSNLSWNNEAKIVPRCSLEQISITSCGLSGEIPEWISSQKDLVFLDLSGNQLEGRFPDWLAEIDVSIVILFDNKLTGSIPARLFDSINLSILALSRNNFSGELPENIGDASGMIILVLSENNFSGQIPKSISNIFGLRLLDLSKNRFSGNSFPVFRNSPWHAYFDFSENDLSGKIPMTFSIFTRLLSLGGNKFSGNVPRNLTNLNMLEHLDLHDNKITGNLLNNV